MLTKNGEEEVMKLLREFYKNESLEAEEISIVPFIKGEIDESGPDEQPRSSFIIEFWTYRDR